MRYIIFGCTVLLAHHPANANQITVHPAVSQIEIASDTTTGSEDLAADLSGELEDTIGEICETFNQDMQAVIGRRPCFERNYCADEFIIRSISNDLKLNITIEGLGSSEWQVTASAELVFSSSKVSTMGFCWHPQLYPPVRKARQEISSYLRNVL